MKYVAKQRPYQIEEKPEVPISGTFDVEQLLEQGGEILRREIKNLLMESSTKKLSAPSARDLVAYVRLLHELREEQKALVANLTDAELTSLTQNSTSQAGSEEGSDPR